MTLSKPSKANKEKIKKKRKITKLKDFFFKYQGSEVDPTKLGSCPCLAGQ